MNRRNQILSGVALLQVVLIAIIFWPGRGANASAEPLFAGVTIDDIQSITVHQGDNHVKVARGGDGWVLPEADDFPVKALSASDTISKVLEIDTRRLVAGNSSSHTRLQVTEDEAVRKVDLETVDGETLSLIVGSSPSFRATNVRRGDSNDVYITSSLQATDLKTDYGSWVDTSYLAIPQEQVTGLTVANAQDTLSFTKVSTDTWTLADLTEDETFNQNNLSSLLTRISGINMTKPLGKEAAPEYGMDAPAATVTIAWQNAAGEAKTTTLTVGSSPAEEGNYVIKSSDSAYYVEVAEFVVENLINRSRTDYLEVPEASEDASIEGTEAITATEFMTDFNTISGTNAITDTVGVTATESVTP